MDCSENHDWSSQWIQNSFDFNVIQGKKIIKNEFYPSSSEKSLPTPSSSSSSSKTKELSNRPKIVKDSSCLIRKRQRSKEKSHLDSKLRNERLDYHPKSVKDLAVSKQKINELKQWMIDSFQNDLRSKEFKFLLLNGPSGSAKTTALRLLAVDLSINLIELPTTFVSSDDTDLILNSMNEMKLSSSTSSHQMIHQNDSVRPLMQESQINRFRRFLIDLNHFKTNKLNLSENDCQKKQSRLSKQILMIKDIPGVFIRRPELLHEELDWLLRKFSSNNHRMVPIVFIISSNQTGKSNSCDNLELRLLPKSVLNKFHFQTITFKPITDHCLTKALKQSEIGQQLTSSQVEEIVLSSSGDIRNAFNYLLFKYSTQNDLYPLRNQSKSLKNKKLKSSSYSNHRNRIGSEEIKCDRNEPLNLSHAIAKILYAKRLDTNEVSMINLIDRFPGIDRNKIRNPLKETNPETFLERLSITSDSLVDWIYENYIDFLPDSSDVDDLQNHFDCIQSLSDSMFFFSSNLLDHQDQLEPLRISFIARSTMFQLNRDRSSYDDLLGRANCCKKSTNKFRALRPPKFFSHHQTIQANQSMLMKIKNLESLSNRSRSNQYFVMEFLPSIKLRPDADLDQIGLLEFGNFINSLVNFDHSI